MVTDPSLVEPAALASLTTSAPRPVLVGLDVDGVLAPIVEHADDARLLDGVLPIVARLADHAADQVVVAVVSGRSVADLEARFEFPASVTVIGSHGLETRSEPAVQLDEAQARRLSVLVELAERAARGAGAGAWLEHKPASVVLHVRGADPATARTATAALAAEARSIEGAHVKLGHEVVELMALTASKATAIDHLRQRHHVATVVYVGDDSTDEDVFAHLVATDVSVRVGPGDTAARFRLAGPDEVRTWLQCVLDDLGRTGRH
jgi:trehalose 6-phosphate phosphatase